MSRAHMHMRVHMHMHVCAGCACVRALESMRMTLTASMSTSGAMKAPMNHGEMLATKSRHGRSSAIRKSAGTIVTTIH